jgi:hypothetical protein
MAATNNNPADPALANNAEAGPPEPPPADAAAAAHALQAERVGGARVAPGGAPAHCAGALAAEDVGAAAVRHPAGALVGGVGRAFADAPGTAKAALAGHDAEVKATHGAGAGHDPTHSKAASKKGIDPGISGTNKIMDARRAHYGVPQGRRTDGGR